ncbi:hypothetical protein GWI33_006850 [Rhynchophorus ferrugineus]|uniref:FAM20 C-terminal domain-containing protein n=1 Tax=Rhynchophorus ferrugineus TaxID=354439 RepID=A0A834MH13_RHYFE|nr:hypothetical protein GWI33_006850 [Rhynchophorus ferrugineus]
MQRKGSTIEVKKNRVEELIYNELKTLPNIYYSSQNEDNDKFEKLLESIKSQQGNDENLNSIWQKANSWVSENQLLNISSSELGKVITAMKSVKIIKSDIDTRGTQLKLLLTLKGDQQVVFKPKWYNEEKIIEGPVYAGKDRYQSEIVAFYLSILLKKPLTPFSVKRNVSFKYEILPVATKRLLATSFEQNESRCIYGKCFYCKKEDPICEDKNNMLTGVVIFNVNKSFNNYRSPWQRTYKKNKKALWQDDHNYCKTVKTKLTKRRLLDLIETSIFDFLMQNGDRHHYETLHNQVLWIDNGKGLGNPFIQHVDILAPLYQCCMIRDAMLKNLLNLAGGELSRKMLLMPDITNLITKDHLNAMEKRLLLIFATIEYCRKQASSEYLHKII